MAGRKALPTNIKKLRGNPGKRKLNCREPASKAGAPACPNHLEGEARAAWEDLGRKLLEMGVLTEADGYALELLCTAYARWREAEAELKKDGLVVKTPKTGYPIQNPYLSIANESWKQIHKLLTEFGLTPSSRSRVNAQPTGAPYAFEKYLNR